jgi:uncharacterized protein with HEPN domain
MSANRLDDYLEDMMGAAKRACKFVEGMPKANFFEDEKTQQAVAMSIVIIGEIATKINEKHVDFVLAHPEIPWDGIRGMRNRIVHAYFAIDWQYVWDTLHKDFPLLVDAITPHVKYAAKQNTECD